jgi:putative ABC transport system permease protein
MRALDRKLWRELRAMGLQALAIALVIVSGVGIFVMSLSTLDSLHETRERYYREYRFAEVFANLERAPSALRERIAAIPGVAQVETRVVAYVNLAVAGFDDPVSAHVLSLPAQGRGLLNQVRLQNGRLLSRGRDDEVLLSAEFAAAHGLEPGSRIGATINGRRKTLAVVGTAHSPEYIYQIAPGAMFPDHERYGVLWMARAPLAAAYDMEGAFNNVTLTLRREARAEDVIDRLDRLLAPFGGTGAVARVDQLSHRFLSEELAQQQTIATVFPVIFFAVAAFLLNVVTARLIALQRDQVGVLKAFGYSDLQVGWHYAGFVALIAAVGIVGGILVGVWMGQGMSRVYTRFYSLPSLVYVIEPGVVLSAAAVSLGVAVSGALFAVRRAVRLPPAQAMRAEAPAVYRASLLERLGLQRRLGQPTRMILRHVGRRPLKSLLTLLGIAMAGGIIMVSGFQEGAIDYMIEVQYGLSQREDLAVSFTEPTAHRALYSLRGLLGVRHVEGYRDVPVRLRFGHRSYRTQVQGVAEAASLTRLLDADLASVPVPAHGVLLTDYLARLLGVAPGDLLTVEVLDGRRPRFEVPVAGTIRQYVGVNAYMRRAQLNRRLDEGDVISGALLQVDQASRRAVYARLRDMPRVAGVVEQASAIAAFRRTVAESILFFTFVSTLLGASIAFGVVYNSLRIALSERSRELASLRVLGFERGEVAYILLGEFGLLTLVAIPLGMLIGYGLCGYLAYSFDSDLYRVPLVLEPRVYALSALVVILSAIASALSVWRDIDRLDMVAVLKTRE